MENEPPRDSLIRKDHDKLINTLNILVVLSVKILAILMIVVIFWGVVDVVMHIWRQLLASSVTGFVDEHLIELLGSFLAVLIAIEIFLNIVFYLKKDAIHVPLVLATALTAVARKVIILDYKTLTPMHILATAAVILAVGLTFWLITKKNDSDIGL